MDGAGIAPLQRDGEVAGRPPCVAFVADDGATGPIARAQAGQGWPASVVEGGVDAAVAALADGPTPSVLLIDLDGVDDPVTAMEGLADLCDPGTRVVAFGSANDVTLFRALLALGVEDYLTKPLGDEAVVQALDRLAQRPARSRQEEPERRGRLLAVVGARGGVGATGLAVNLAWLAAERHGRRTVLVDLDLRFGTTALALDRDPGRGLRDALANPERVDDLFLQRAAVKLTQRLSLLCAEEEPDQRTALTEEGVEQVADRLRAGFDAVVVDLPRTEMAVAGQLDEGDRLLVATDYTLAGLRDAARLLRHVRAARPHVEVAVVVMQVGAPGRAEVVRADLEKALSAPVAAEIPFEPKPFVASARIGVPVVRHAPRSRAAAALCALSDRLDPAPVALRPLWKRLLRRR